MVNNRKLLKSAFANTLLISFVFACSSPVTISNRSPSSLDNNGDEVDDGFDENLESYYGGSAQVEAKANESVANIIRSFIDAQKKARTDMAASPAANQPKAQRVFQDLPAPTYATRDVHRKTNGCFKGELTFAKNLSQSINAQLQEYQKSDLNNELGQLAQVYNEDDLGVFARGKSYDAVIRFSNGHPGNRPDRLPDARGLAVKILDKGTLKDTSIAGNDAETLNGKTKLDILSINFPTFFVNDPVKYAAFNQSALDSSMDFKGKWASKLEELASVFKNGKLTSLERRLALWVNGSIIYSPLFQDYFSMVPSRLGPKGAIRAVKYSWAPVVCPGTDRAEFEKEKSVAAASWTNDHTYALPPHEPEAVKPFPDDYLRKNISERLAQNDFCFDLFFQLYRDTVSTNIEDSLDLWPRSEAEKNNWAKNVVPSPGIWRADLDNTESRSSYLNRFNQKHVAPPIFAGKLRIASTGQTAESGNSKTCEDLSFNPWNGDILHHKPLGIVSRMKRKAYNASRRERHSLNGINDSMIERPAH